MYEERDVVRMHRYHGAVHSVVRVPVPGPYDPGTGAYVGPFTVTELLELGCELPEAMWIVMGIPVDIGRSAVEGNCENILQKLPR